MTLNQDGSKFVLIQVLRVFFFLDSAITYVCIIHLYYDLAFSIMCAQYIPITGLVKYIFSVGY